uniref:Uncharacterized protein n=1 Tax=Setaria italica TaxID=4555 RepID=K3XY40_SETIT
MYERATFEALIEQHFEPGQSPWLHGNNNINSAAVRAGDEVHAAAERDGRRANERRPAPAEVQFGERQTQPADDPQVRLRDDRPLRRRAARRLFQVVHQRPYELVAQPGGGVGDPGSGGGERARGDVAHLGHRQRADDGVAEVAIRERWADAGPGVGGHVHPGVVLRSVGGAARRRLASASPNVGDHRVERGYLLPAAGGCAGAGLERVNMVSGDGEDGGVERDLRVGPAGDVSPRDGRPKAHRAAAKERHLEHGQDAGVVAAAAVGRRDKRPPQLVRRGKVAHLIEPGIRAGNDEERPVAGAADFRAAGAVRREPASEGVEGDERLGQGGLQDVR